MIDALDSIHRSLEHQTNAVGGIAREQAAGNHVFERELGTISADIKLLIGQMRGVLKRLGATEEDIDAIKAEVLLRGASNGNGSGSADAE